jgi:hypothetical protein
MSYKPPVYPVVIPEINMNTEIKFSQIIEMENLLKKPIKPGFFICFNSLFFI